MPLTPVCNSFFGWLEGVRLPLCSPRSNFATVKRCVKHFRRAGPINASGAEGKMRRDCGSQLAPQLGYDPCVIQSPMLLLLLLVVLLLASQGAKAWPSKISNASFKPARSQPMPMPSCPSNQTWVRRKNYLFHPLSACAQGISKLQLLPSISCSLRRMISSREVLLSHCSLTCW